MTSRLRSRLDRLQTMLQAKADPKAEEKQTREYVLSWMDNDPHAIPYFREFENHCTKMGYGSERRSWVDAARNDPIAEQLGRRVLESYKCYVETNCGVTVDEVDSAFN